MCDRITKAREQMREFRKKHPHKTAEVTKKYLKTHPWAKTYNRIASRCNYVYGKYHKKGRKNFLKIKDLKYLWFRDKVWLMKKPSIHRIDNNKDYTLDNCKYIEMSENTSLGSKGRKLNRCCGGRFIKST